MAALTGKVALITGAGGQHGIGRAIATRFAREGADVVVNDHVECPYANRATGWNGLPDVVQEIESIGRRAGMVVADITDRGQVERMVSQVVECFGGLDILVNNAGSRPGRDRVPVVELDEEVWDYVQRVNAKGTFLCSQAAARAMIEANRGGRIINMSSASGKVGYARTAAYCASKFAIVGFTQVLALELASHHITVNAICPALVDTERVDCYADSQAPQDVSASEFRAQHVRQTSAGTPLGRIAIPSDVANVAAFLAAPESDFLTGLALTVSGGAVMS
jgi:meso-butanediol dehydrogenase / (S,S)-butanediol dehydrogenase / diacetyl reductase